jgi:hypothetical protein
MGFELVNAAGYFKPGVTPKGQQHPPPSEVAGEG